MDLHEPYHFPGYAFPKHSLKYLTSCAVTRPKLVVIQQEMYRGGMKACKYYTRSIYRFITMLSKDINILITAEQLLQIIRSTEYLNSLNSFSFVFKFIESSYYRLEGTMY